MSTAHDPDTFNPSLHLISDRELDRLATAQLRAEEAFAVHARREQLAATGNDNGASAAC